MTGSEKWRSGKRGHWWWVPYAAVVVGAAVAWVIADRRSGTTADVAAAIMVCVALAGLFERSLDRRREDARAALAPASVDHELLEEWRSRMRLVVDSARVDEGGQLDQMIRFGETVDPDVELVADAQRPRLLVGERLRPWSEIKHAWEESSGRLVVLGDPGYGKTVAALTLVAHINARDEPGANVAEIFSLADWHRWHSEHPRGLLNTWLAEQLTHAYPRDLPLEVSRELIAHRLVLPILDGLDEISAVDDRRACIDAIDAYARKTEPHRPFVLTCRAAEYHELAPDWVQADQVVRLFGLQRTQVIDIVDRRTHNRPGWSVIRQRLETDDSMVAQLFRSPLYLTIALQVHRDSRPSALHEPTLGAAQGALWQLLLAKDEDGFRGAGADDVAHWLAFLARGIKRTKRQRFLLHELYLLDTDQVGAERRFRLVVGVVVAAISCVVYVLASAWSSGWCLGSPRDCPLGG